MTLQLPLSQQNFRPLLLKSILVPLNFTISIFYKSCYDKVKCKKCAYKIQVWVIISITHLYEGRTYSTLQNTYTVCNVTKKGQRNTIYCNMEIDFLREIASWKKITVSKILLISSFEKNIRVRFNICYLQVFKNTSKHPLWVQNYQRQSGIYWNWNLEICCQLLFFKWVKTVSFFSIFFVID